MGSQNGFDPRGWLGMAGSHQGTMRKAVKVAQNERARANRRFWSMFPLTRATHFGIPVLSPYPCGFEDRFHVRGAICALEQAVRSRPSWAASSPRSARKAATVSPTPMAPAFCFRLFLIRFLFFLGFSFFFFSFSFFSGREPDKTVLEIAK